MKPLLRARAALTFLWCVAAATSAPAADRCRPTQLLQVGDAVTFHADEPGPQPRLEGTLTRALVLHVPLASLGTDLVDGQPLAHDVSVAGQVVGREALFGKEWGILRVDASEADGSTVGLRAGEQRLSATLRQGEVQDTKGRTLKLSPNRFGTGGFEIGQGAVLRSDGPGRLIVAAGARLTWRARPGLPMKAFVEETAVLRQTTPSVKGVAASLRPVQAPIGAEMVVELAAEGLDLRQAVPAFCFDIAGASAPVSAKQVQFVEQSGDRVTYKLRLSSEAAEKLVDDRPWWDRLRGVPATLTAIAYDKDQPVMETSLETSITSAGWATVAGTAFIFALYLICAAVMREGNPVKIGARWIRQPSGHYSLSNLQLLLWSLLVLFAMTFSWVSTNELLTLSQAVLGMLGIAGGSSVLARGVERMDPNQPAEGAAPATPNKTNLVADKDGHFDLLRFQMLGFTLFAWVYSLASVVRCNGIPDLPETLYWLMGISNTTYVAGKVPALMGPAKDEKAAPGSALNETEKALAPERIKLLQAALAVAATGQLDTATRDALKQYKARNSLYPANDRVTAPLLKRLAV